MNKLIIFFAAILLVSGTITGCKKNNSSDGYTPFMKASINDSLFYITGQTLVYSSSATSAGNNYLYIYGEETYGDVIRITLVNSSRTGTFQFGGTNVSAYYYPDGLLNPYSQAVSGYITLTSVSPDVEGVFSFTCADGTQVKNGSFSVKGP
jgi:hypothetical protein